MTHPTIQSSTALMEKQIPPMNWAIPGLIPEGLTLLAGPPKAGKSWLITQCLLAVASGGTVLDDRKAQQGRVLYLDLEESESLVQDRLEQLLDGAKAPDFDIAYEWPRMPDCETELAWYLTEHPDTRLVVIDMLVEIVPPTTGKRGPNYHEDYAIGIALKKLTREHHTSIVVVHHTSKREPSLSNPFSLISGTTGLSGMTDANIVLYEWQGERRLAAQGKALSEPLNLELSRDDGKWVSTEPLLQHTAEWAATEEIFRRQHPLTPTEFSTLAQLPPSVGKKRLQRYYNRGWLTRDHGQYDTPSLSLADCSTAELEEQSFKEQHATHTAIDNDVVVMLCPPVPHVSEAPGTPPVDTLSPTQTPTNSGFLPLGGQGDRGTCRDMGLPEFITRAHSELGLNPRQASELLGVKTLAGLDFREALDRLRQMQPIAV